MTDYRGNDADTEMISNITAANPQDKFLTDKKVPAGSPLLTHKMVSVLFIFFHTEQGFIPSVKHFQPQKNGVHGSLLVANIAVVRTLFFFCNFPGGNGFRVFQQEHLLADGSSISMLTRRFNWKLREGLSFR